MKQRFIQLIFLESRKFTCMMLASGEKLLIILYIAQVPSITGLETNLKEAIQKSIASVTRKTLYTNVVLGMLKPEVKVKIILFKLKCLDLFDLLILEYFNSTLNFSLIFIGILVPLFYISVHFIPHPTPRLVKIYSI